MRYHVITTEDVREFHQKLVEEYETLTSEKARQKLIESGVFDQNGVPRWPERVGSEFSPPEIDAGQRR